MFKKKTKSPLGGEGEVHQSVLPPQAEERLLRGRLQETGASRGAVGLRALTVLAESLGFIGLGVSGLGLGCSELPVL